MEHISEVIGLWIRKLGHITEMIWPATCLNCKGRGKVLATEYCIAMTCPVCDGKGYLRD